MYYLQCVKIHIHFFREVAAHAEPTTSNPEKTADTKIKQGNAEQEKNGEPTEMTLDEYRKQQTRQQNMFKVRQAGEGCDNSQWKGTIMLKKKMDESEEEDAEEVRSKIDMVLK